ncbi:hypothetical protein [Moraxella phage Mcat24]|nr:hypothetical protein [Moraxella phage Mcat24]
MPRTGGVLGGHQGRLFNTILSKYATKDEIPQINTDGLTIDTSNLATKTSVETLANKVTEASEALKSETKLRANSTRKRFFIKKILKFLDIIQPYHTQKPIFFQPMAENIASVRSI